MRTESELSTYEQQKIAGLTKDASRYADPVVQKYDNKFLMLAFQMDENEQIKVVNSYVQHIAGIEPTDPNWSNKAGKRLNGIGDAPYDGIKFWENISQDLPGIFSEEEKKWLVENDPHASGALNLLSYMTFFHPETTSVISLMDSIVAYK
jgi:hypothetical protein